MIAPETILQNRYRILAQVGGGGMGTVYQAEDLRLAGHLDAIKAFSPANVPQEDRTWAMTYFRQEAQILAKLNHKGLARVSNFFNEGEMWFLVMDWVDGETLSDYLQKAGGHLSVEESIAIVDQLCDVLQYLHNQQPPVIFRDLKPSNIMINQQRQVKLIDFGTARFFKLNQSRDTVNLGTPGYAAPEQYGCAGQSDARADIYSLGVVLHELLTGYNPTITPFRLPPITTLNPTASPYLGHIIEKATSMDVETRYQTVTEFQQALHQREMGTTPLGNLYPGSRTVVQEPLPTHSFTPTPELFTPNPSSFTPAEQESAVNFTAQQGTQFPPSHYTAQPVEKKRLPAWVIITVLGIAVVSCAAGVFVISRLLGSTRVTPTLEWAPTNTPTITETTPSRTLPPETPTLTSTTETGITPSPTADLASLEQDLLENVTYRSNNGKVIFAYHAAGAPSIDGNLDDWTGTIYSVPYNVYDPDNTWTGPDDLSASFQISWDSEYLYLAVQVIDDVHAQNETGDTIFKGDDLDIQIDADLAGDFANGELTGDDGQVGISPGNFVDRNPESYIWLPAQRETANTGIKIAAIKTAQGYIVETAVPWPDLGGRPDPEMPVGFNLNISDNDNVTTSIQQVMLSTSPNRTWSDPRTWGTLIIVDW
jgi:serine/threonine protein kinase